MSKEMNWGRYEIGWADTLLTVHCIYLLLCHTIYLRLIICPCTLCSLEIRQRIQVGLFVSGLRIGIYGGVFRQGVKIGGMIFLGSRNMNKMMVLFVLFFLEYFVSLLHCLVAVMDKYCLRRTRHENVKTLSKLEWGIILSNAQHRRTHLYCGSRVETNSLREQQKISCSSSVKDPTDANTYPNQSPLPIQHPTHPPFCLNFESCRPDVESTRIHSTLEPPR